ncbi:MAG: DUF1640 domain-containing protein [Lachnospiraceae bacterium]|nr:DUF1640 domain-containing protein [Lachnospiraceae bacterium]
MDYIQTDIHDLKSDVKELKSDVSDLKSEVQIFKSDVSDLKSEVQTLKSDVFGLKSDVQMLKSDVSDLQSNVHIINLNLENNIDKRLQTIEKCYTSTYRRYSDGIEDLDTMKDDIYALKTIVRHHEENFKKLSC